MQRKSRDSVRFLVGVACYAGIIAMAACQHDSAKAGTPGPGPYCPESQCPTATDDGGTAPSDDGGTPSNTCETDSDCPNGHLCTSGWSNNRCIPQGMTPVLGTGPCRTDADCPRVSWCDRGVCLHCLDGTCKTPHCEVDQDCLPSQICFYPYRVTRRDGYALGYCLGPICGYPLKDSKFYHCNRSESCPYAWTCITRFGDCFPNSLDAASLGPSGTTDCNDPRCTADSDCSSGRYCNIYNFCEKYPPTDGGVPNDMCDSDDDCANGETCMNTPTGVLCVRPPDVFCDNDGQCPLGQTCNDLRCTANTDGGCPPPADGGTMLPPVSDGGTMPPADSGTPPSSLDAGSPATDAGVAGKDGGGGSDSTSMPPGGGCTLQPDCPDDQECQDGVCVPMPPCEENFENDRHTGRFMCHGHYPNSGNSGQGVMKGHTFHCRCPHDVGAVLR